MNACAPGAPCAAMIPKPMIVWIAQGCKALGIRSMVAVPIRPGSKVAGLLEVFSPQPYAFNANDIGALQQLTGSILPRPWRPIAEPAHRSLRHRAPGSRRAAFTADIASARSSRGRPRFDRGQRSPTGHVGEGLRASDAWHKSSFRGRDRHFYFCSAMADCALDLEPDALVRAGPQLSAQAHSFANLPSLPGCPPTTWPACARWLNKEIRRRSFLWARAMPLGKRSNRTTPRRCSWFT